MGKEIIASINVGSNSLRMEIGEITETGVFKSLESVRKGISVGHDTFNEGKILRETIEKVEKVLVQFKKLLEEYGVKTYNVYATSAIREASNRKYLIDQIMLRTGVQIEVLDNSLEQYLTLKALKYNLKEYDQIMGEGALVVIVGAGSVQISVYQKGALVSSQNVKMGALRVKEILSDLEKETIKYHQLLDEFIEVNLEGLEFYRYREACKHFIAIGGQVGFIKSLMNLEDKKDENQVSFSRSKFKKMTNKLRYMSAEEIYKAYNLPIEAAGIVVPGMMLFEKIISEGNFDKITSPFISLTDGMIRELYENIYCKNDDYHTTKDIISNAKSLAKKFHYNKNHNDYVGNLALQIFDKFKEIHQLSGERVLLEVACILHDIGKYLGVDNHAMHAYNIIKALEIIGLSEAQMEIIANISLYHGVYEPSERERQYKYLSDEDQLIVSKLVAIIRLADGLDRSHTQKIEIQSIKLKAKTLIFRGISRYNTKLEEWTFKKRRIFFEDVYGIKPVLKIKKDI